MALNHHRNTLLAHIVHLPTVDVQQGPSMRTRIINVDFVSGTTPVTQELLTVFLA